MVRQHMNYGLKCNRLMITGEITSFIWLPALAYLLGSIPWGVILTRKIASLDIRRQGSGNIGATNVSRVAGSTLGLLTLAGDILKGMAPVYLAFILAGENQHSGDLLPAVAGLGAFFGHLFPLFMKFKDGGKGVATCAGCFIILSPPACLSAVLTFIFVLVASKRVSAGSLAAAAVLPGTVWFSTGSAPFTTVAGIMAIFIVIRHRDNIKRLISGTEPIFKDKL
jgi:glycerol-3-phosphate acyltransferase PlsY